MPPAAKKTPARATAARRTAARGAAVPGAVASTTTEAPRGRAAGGGGYRQVADALRDQIGAGLLPVGAPIPSEAQLMAAHGVSRPTARAAVAALAAQGLVVTYHGRGSFVRRADGRPSLTHPRGVVRTGTRATAMYRDAEVDDPQWQPVETASTYRTDATADLALALGLPEGAPLFAVDRLLTDPAGRRLSHRLYVPFAVAAEVPALEADPFQAPGDLYTALTAAGQTLAWTETVRARMPSPDDAAALRIPGGTPLLITRRTTRTRDGRPLTLEETRVSAEDAQLAYTITPAAAGRLERL